MLSKTILLAASAIGQHPDAVLAAVLAGLIMGTCLYVAGWMLLLFWIFE